jgi:ethanolamine utilization protein EutP (predicted NTPase)
MATSTEIANGLLDVDPPVAEATTYEADTREINPETDTVHGQLNAIIDDGSTYMQRAKNKGLEFANSRGLLNSSIAGQATQAAAIDAALPIAQQDASIYMTQKMANQDSTNKALAQNAKLTTDTSGLNAKLDSSMNEKALGVLSAADLQAQADAGAYARQELSNAGALERQQTSDAATMERLQVSEDADTARAEASITANRILQDMSIAAGDREVFSAYYNNRGEYQLRELARLAENPDLSEAEKTSRIAEINDSYVNDITLISSLFNIPLEL